MLVYLCAGILLTNLKNPKSSDLSKEALWKRTRIIGTRFKTKKISVGLDEAFVRYFDKVFLLRNIIFYSMSLESNLNFKKEVQPNLINYMNQEQSKILASKIITNIKIFVVSDVVKIISLSKNRNKDT